MASIAIPDIDFMRVAAQYTAKWSVIMDPNFLLASTALSWFAEFKDLFLVLAGGICGAFGALLNDWYHTKTARRRRMEEVIGEQKVDACKKASRLAYQLRSILIQGVHANVLNFIKEENSWVLDNEILLPQKFTENWHSVRNNVLSAQRQEETQAKMSDGPERDSKIEELVAMDQFNRQLAQEAEDVIRKELGLSPFKIHHPPKGESPKGGGNVGG